MNMFEQRRNDFHDLYDVESDPGVTLAHIVQAAGDFLAEIVGPENADPGMSRVIGPLLHEAATAGTDWRECLEENESGAFSEWPMGRLLHDLTAFAQYGIDIETTPGEDVTDVEHRLAKRVAAAEAFLSRCPLDAWLGPDRAGQLEKTVAMARCRLALDRGQPVEPGDLAALGNISQSRMRSLVSGKAPELKRENGRIPAEIALPWLEQREEFLPSIWRAQGPRHDAVDPAGAAARLEEPLFLPRAKDGSVFHPGLKAAGGFRIGPKGNECSVETFRDALAELQKMPVPYWRRPSATTGTPGIVRGESWVRKSTSEFAHGV